MSTATGFEDLDPKDAARRILDARRDQRAWLDAFAEHLDRQRSAQSLMRTFSAWGLSQAEAARLFGVSRQAVGKWLERGVPSERAEIVADLAAATDILVHHLKRDRIPAVVRRPIPAFPDSSLLALWERGQTRALLEICREMFTFERSQG